MSGQLTDQSSARRRQMASVASLWVPRDPPRWARDPNEPCLSDLSFPRLKPLNGTAVELLWTLSKRDGHKKDFNLYQVLKKNNNNEETDFYLLFLYINLHLFQTKRGY